MRLTIVFLSGLFIFIPQEAQSRNSTNPVRPEIQHYQIAENMAQCSAVKRVYFKIKEKMQYIDEELKLTQANLTEKREFLESCGIQNGLPSVLTGQKKEEFLAFHCPEAYDDWLSPNYQTLTVEEESSNAQSSLEQAKRFLEKHCPPLS
jgi:hypothetical protein